jgi:hypothetical protein
MESTIADEAKRFVSVVAKERGSPVCINGLINKAADLYTAVHETRHLVQILKLETGLPSECTC